MRRDRPQSTAIARVADINARRSAALAESRSFRRTAILAGLSGLAIAGVLAVNPFMPLLAATGLLCVVGSVFSVSSARTSRRKAATLQIQGLPQSLLHRVGRLPSPLHPNVRWRLERALDAQIHIKAFLRHVQRQQPVSWATALARDAASCVEHVVDRCDALLDLYAIQVASPTVQSSIATIESQIDVHLVELSEAMDATATYIAFGTRDAAVALQVRAENLQALAAGLKEAFAADSTALPPHPPSESSTNA